MDVLPNNAKNTQVPNFALTQMILSIVKGISMKKQTKGVQSEHGCDGIIRDMEELSEDLLHGREQQTPGALLKHFDTLDLEFDAHYPQKQWIIAWLHMSTVTGLLRSRLKLYEAKETSAEGLASLDFVLPCSKEQYKAEVKLLSDRDRQLKRKMKARRDEAKAA